MNINQICHRMKGICLKVLNKGGQVPPTLICLKDGKAMSLDIGDIPKHMAGATIQYVVDQLHPDAVIMVVESWMVIRNDDQVHSDLAANKIIPSTAPDRTECIVMSVKTPTTSTSTIYKIIRGKKVTLKSIGQTTEIKNRFLDNIFTELHTMH